MPPALPRVHYRVPDARRSLTSKEQCMAALIYAHREYHHPRRILCPHHFLQYHLSRTIVCCSTLLLADTDSSSSSTCGLGVLTSDSKTPIVSQATMGSDLLQSFQILTKLAFHAVCQNLGVLAIDNIALSVQEPCWDLVLCRVLDNCDNSLKFLGCDLTSPTQTSILSSSRFPP